MKTPVIRIFIISLLLIAFTFIVESSNGPAAYATTAVPASHTISSHTNIGGNNPVDCNSGNDYFTVWIANGGPYCFADAGLMGVDIALVTRICSGNNTADISYYQALPIVTPPPGRQLYYDSFDKFQCHDLPNVELVSINIAG